MSALTPKIIQFKRVSAYWGQVLSIQNKSFEFQKIPSHFWSRGFDILKEIIPFLSNSLFETLAEEKTDYQATSHPQQTKTLDSEI